MEYRRRLNYMSRGVAKTSFLVDYVKALEPHGAVVAISELEVGDLPSTTLTWP